MSPAGPSVVLPNYRKLVAGSSQAVVHSSFLGMAHGEDGEQSITICSLEYGLKLLSHHLNLPEAKCRAS